MYLTAYPYGSQLIQSFCSGLVRGRGEDGLSKDREAKLGLDRANSREPWMRVKCNPSWLKTPPN